MLALQWGDGRGLGMDSYSAATEERTGEVKEMRTRKDPENAKQLISNCYTRM